MDDIRAILEGLSPQELDYVLARSKASSDRQACANAGIPRSTFHKWGAVRRAELADIALKLRHSTVIRALLILEEAAERAAGRIVELTDNRNPNVALRAAQDVLDRTAGKPAQRQEITGAGGESLAVRVMWDNETNGDGDADR